MILYRGENTNCRDSQRIYYLKLCLREGLTADFINGGNPYLIQTQGLLKTVSTHVAGCGDNVIDFNKKTMISFTSDESIARKYAAGRDAFFDYQYEEDHTVNHSSGNFDHDNWEETKYLIIELNTSNKIAEPGPEFGYIMNVNSNKNKIFLIDVYKYLSLEIKRRPYFKSEEMEQLSKACENASRDQEWLVMSLDLISPNPGSPPSFSAIIPHCNEMRIKHYFK